MYELRLGAGLDANWKEYLSAERLVRESESLTCVRIKVQDQSALFGVLKKVRDLAVPLISLNEIEEAEGSK